MAVDPTDPRYTVTITEESYTVTFEETNYAVNVVEQDPYLVTVATAGVPGLDGATILTGDGAPSDLVGNTGDWYIDTTNERLYGPKESGGWAATYIELSAQQDEIWPFGRTGTLYPVVSLQRLPITFNGVITSVKAAVGTAPGTQPIILDVNLNGTTIFSNQANRPSILAGQNESAEVVPDVTTFSDGDYLTVDIDQVGVGPAGSELTVVVRVTY